MGASARTRRRLLVGAALATTIAGARSAAAVEGGQEDSVTTHAVSIATGGPSRPQVRCSGTLVSPNVVLTVRHCIAPLAHEPTCDQSFAEPPGLPGDFWVDATPWSTPSPRWKNVAGWVVPDAAGVCGNDIALLVLASPFTDAEATPARPVLAEAEFRHAVSGRILGIAAFGSSSASGTDGGLRRSRFDIPIQCVPGSTAFSCEGALEYIDVNEFTGGAGPCTGDSGAAAILPNDHASVFGVLSRGNLARGSCAEGIFERTDLWRWLIAKTVLAATPSGMLAPEWARASFPERPKTGELCLGAGSCGDDADCASFDGRRSFVCARRCTAGGCGDGFHCESNVCTPGAAPTSQAGGCTISSDPAGQRAPSSSIEVAVVGLTLVGLRAIVGRGRRRRRA